MLIISLEFSRASYLCTKFVFEALNGSLLHGITAEWHGVGK